MKSRAANQEYIGRSDILFTLTAAAKKYFTFHLSYRTVRIWETRSTKAIATIPTKGENINIAWAPDGKTIAVGNKEDLVTFIDAKSHKIVREEQFKFEVNEIDL